MSAPDELSPLANLLVLFGLELRSALARSAHPERIDQLEQCLALAELAYAKEMADTLLTPPPAVVLVPFEGEVS